MSEYGHVVTLETIADLVAVDSCQSIVDDIMAAARYIRQLEAENAALRRRVPKEIKDLVDGLLVKGAPSWVARELAAAIEKAEE